MLSLIQAQCTMLCLKAFWYMVDTASVAMKGLCMHVQEFSDWIITQDSTFEVAYAIEQDKVANLTVRLQFNNDSKWTKALKFMLTNLKYCLNWVIRQQLHTQSLSGSATSVVDNAVNQSSSAGP